MSDQIETSAVAAQPTEGSWLVSILFWLTLLFSAVLYGCVALAPKFQIWMNLRADHYANQVQLVRLEEQVTYLKKVANALENDPHFAAEVARMEFRAGRSGAESIPVEKSLSLSAQTAPAVVERPTIQLPWYSAIVDRLATKRKLRFGVLAFAGMLVVSAFVFLQDANATAIRNLFRTMFGGLRAIAGRYYQKTMPPREELAVADE